MTNSLVPRVSVNETFIGASSLLGTGTVVVGVIGTSELGPQNQVIEITSMGAAETIFGANHSFGAELVSMIRIAFSEGAAVVKAVSIGQPTVVESTTIATAVVAGDTTIDIAAAGTIAAGDFLYVGTGQPGDSTEEKVEVVSLAGTVVTVATPFAFPHAIGLTVTKITPKATADYAAAFDAMEIDEGKVLVVCEANDSATIGDENTPGTFAYMIEQSTEDKETMTVGIVGAEWSDDETTISAKASTLNNDRIILVYSNPVDYYGRVYTPGETAAAVAGAISRNGVPKLNHNLTQLQTAFGVRSVITDNDLLIQNGITGIRKKRNKVQIVRFLTTRTQDNAGVPSTKWQEGAIRLNVDQIERACQRRIEDKFLQTGNTPEVREAIKQELISVLSQFASEQVLLPHPLTGAPAFTTPQVFTNPTDDTHVICQMQIAVGKPLNFIDLNFRVVV